MLKVKDLDKFSEMVEIEETERKIVKKTRQRRIKELVEQGIDKTLATIMVDSYVSCGVLNEW